MTIILFSCSDYLGRYNEYSYGGNSLEACLDILSETVRQGYKLDKIYLIEQNRQIELPVEAFDGKLMSVTVKSLQTQWERILC